MSPRWMSNSVWYTFVRWTTRPKRYQSAGDTVSSDQV